MLFVSHIRRKTQIAKVFTKYGYEFILEALGLETYIPKGKFFKKVVYKHKPEERLRLAFEELGVTFIKLGQILSVRPDLLPESYIEELSKLQDKVPPVPASAIKKVIEEEFGKKVEEIFDYFEDKPLASASIGQVHRARLKDGTRVVLKVQKPGVEKQVEEDLAIFEEIVELAMHTKLAQKFDLRGLYEEFAYLIRNELNYIREGRNCETFRRNFKGDKDAYIPKVFWDYTTKRVLCLEEIEGIKISDVKMLRIKGFDLKELAKRGTRIYLKMIFRDGFYHADPHPGNFLVMRDGRIAILDFGMVGVLDSFARFNLYQVLYGIINNDIELVLDGFYDLGIYTEPKKESYLKRELEILLSYYFMQPIKKIKLSQLVNDIFKLSRVYNVRMPTDLYLLLKTFALAEGLAMKLNPEFRMINELSPYVKRGFLRMLRSSLSKDELRRNTIIASKLATQGVVRTKKLLTSLQRGEFGISIKYKGEEKILSELKKNINRLAMSVITLGFLLATALIVLSITPQFISEAIIYGFLVFTLILLIFGFIKLKET